MLTWSCWAAAGCTDADASGMLGAAAGADPVGACMSGSTLAICTLQEDPSSDTCMSQCTPLYAWQQTSVATVCEYKL